MENLIEHMKVVLASALSLYLSTHVAHWNVTGSDFYQLHKMLDDQYRDIWESLDDIAEHLRALDGMAPQSYETYGALSEIPSLPENMFDTNVYLLFLVKTNEIMVEVLNKTIKVAEEQNQQGILNFLAGRVEQHQRHRWMLSASVKK